MFSHPQRRRARRRKLRAKYQIDLALHYAYALAGRDRGPLERLVLRVRQHTNWLRAQPAGGVCAWFRAEAFIAALLALAAHERSWRRDLESWLPTGESGRSQFATLTSHLLAKQPPPAFMTSVWFEGRSPAARRHQMWYKHLALGHDIRGLTTPIPLTRAMSQYFMQAPDHCSVRQALRWAQVRGLGGDAPLADAIAATHLGESFEHEAYWSQVIRFLIDSPELEVGNIAAIVEYLHTNRRLCRRQHLGRRARRKAAEEFIREVRRWHGRSLAARRASSQSWKRSAIGEFEHHDTQRLWQPASWSIRELTSADQLREEGRHMRHCVGSSMYMRLCLDGVATIWSLTCSDGRSRCRRELTIDVDPKTREIMEAKGPRNAPPTPAARRVLLLWANRERLRFEDKQ